MSTNPIDHALIPTYARACLDLRPEDPRLLCRRVYGDLIGRMPTTAEAERCRVESYEQTLRALEAHPRHRLQAERHWRDAFQLEPETDWRYRKRLYDRVDAMLAGELAYDQFVEAVLSDPAWVLAGPAADRAFSTFLGRAPTEYERRSFDRLYAVWFASYRRGGDDNLPVAELGASLDPYACAAIGGCSSALFGGALVDLGLLPVDENGAPRPIAFEDLSPPQLEAIRIPGQLIAREPAIWEAAADRMLDRFLAYDDGELLPRNPGVILPEVRAALAEALRAGGYPVAERILLSSWLYRQRATAELDRPIWAVGPWKRAPNEVLLDSLLNGAGLEIGVCEPRYPMRRYQRELLQKHALGGLDLEELEAAFTVIVERIEPRTRNKVSERGIIEPDLRYEDLADLLGGCNTRVPDPGVSTALAHESFIEDLCGHELAPAAAPGEGAEVIRSLLADAVDRDLGRSASTTELEGVIGALSGCGDGCRGLALAKAICEAVAGSGEMLFY